MPKKVNVIEITEDKPYTVPKGKVLYIGSEKIGEGSLLEIVFSPLGLRITGVMMDASEAKITIGEPKESKDASNRNRRME